MYIRFSERKCETVNPMCSKRQVSKACAHQLSETEEIGHTYSAQEKKYLLFETHNETKI